MLPVISDPGLYLCIFCSLRLKCGATTEPMGDGLGHMDDDRAQKVVTGHVGSSQGLQVTPVLTQDGRCLQMTVLG